MQTPLAIYLASILGAVALLLIMPKRRFNLGLVGAVIGAAALGGLWLFLAASLPSELAGIPWETFGYYYLFAAISIVGAVRVITHTRPVYSALWFVMVVLSSAGLLLILAAEFMAFAMIIIYGGAILVTYMFVIMLATQSAPAVGEDSPANEPDVSPDYDRVAREPVGAIVAGFLLLAVLLQVTTDPGITSNEAAWMESDEQLMAEVLTNRPSMRLTERIQAQLNPELGTETEYAVALGGTQGISNTERVGLDLFRSHPLGLELAGIILLIALIGAVVIAKTRIEEEEKPTPPVPDETGATTHPHDEPGPHDSEARGASGGRVGT
ncbi:NADH-quinone oxidoreductase subunit J [Phycisphaerales bacterium AB-hyl4]|uniref:NADH-quinone oxidoreductase subunit J n=1 Tax=Natronomicrosphaera hydrolytica TaxID=3242702 RepID=A0ABV4U157_9BACT